MALTAKIQDTEFGVGDRVRVVQRIKEGDKSRLQAFEGMVMGIKGSQENKTFTVRRIGAGLIGVERIFPVNAPTIEKIQVLKNGTKGVRHAKLFYTRDKSRREISKIYSRETLRK